MSWPRIEPLAACAIGGHFIKDLSRPLTHLTILIHYCTLCYIYVRFVKDSWGIGAI
jgi:hypothetical protein